MHARTAPLFASILIATLLTSALVFAPGCASSSRARFHDAETTASNMAEGLEVARRAMARDFEGVLIDKKSGVVTAEPLYIDFAINEPLNNPEEAPQILGRIRRVATIKVDEHRGGASFQVKVERQVEELDAGYVRYDTAYDLNQSSSMPVDPSAYSGSVAPPKEEWVPQGNDVEYEDRLRRALAEEIGR